MLEKRSFLFADDRELLILYATHSTEIAALLDGVEEKSRIPELKLGIDMLPKEGIVIPPPITPNKFCSIDDVGLLAMTGASLVEIIFSSSAVSSRDLATLIV